MIEREVEVLQPQVADALARWIPGISEWAKIGEESADTVLYYQNFLVALQELKSDRSGNSRAQILASHCTTFAGNEMPLTSPSAGSLHALLAF